jgi:2OG-Fe(II) oxygenase superfamily
MPFPMHVFKSREWHETLATLMGVPATGDVYGEFLHYPAGSKSGTVHNDLSPVWFANEADPACINLSGEKNAYFTGEYGSDVAVRQTERAVIAQLFLHNPPWQPGDGGETGLYTDPNQPVDKPTKSIPPINNSLVIFECLPDSYYSFIVNPAGPCNSMVIWLHRPVKEPGQRSGENEVVPRAEKSLSLTP